MKNILDILTSFFSLMKNEVLEYFRKSSSYLKDLIIYKKIDLNRIIESESDRQIKNSLEKLLKAIKTGLNTLGVPMNELNTIQSNFLECLNTEKFDLLDYNSFFEIYIENYGKEVLLLILLDYLFDIDTKKLENVNLFDLLPDNFISKLNEFKNTQINSKQIQQEIHKFNYKGYINFTDLSIKRLVPLTEPDILTQLRVAKQDIIETLNIPKKELIKTPIGNLKENSVFKEPDSVLMLSKTTPPEYKEFDIKSYSNSFLDTIGKFTPMNQTLINEFKIDKVNLINLKMINKEFFDLENLFYYISVVKMLNLEFPLTESEILNVLKDYLNGEIFSSSKDNPPDLQNIFYGLSIYSELNLYDKIDQIDLIKIEKFLKSELEPFIPEKVHSNFYCLLCLKLLAQNKPIEFNRNSISKLVYDLNILKLENPKLPTDIYNHLALIKLLNKDLNLLQLKPKYFDELKKLIAPNGSINNLVTDTAQTLLIFTLFNLKQQEPELCSSLLNYLVNATKFFNISNLNEDFNWRIDKIGFSTELEMLFWALLASSQFVTT
ncbi:MAG: hypothetical protein ACFFCV_09035 [Promethearchaeota archaeon]